MHEEENSRQERLEYFGVTIASKRDEAIKARSASGIEDIWKQCEEAYLGIDDANRAEFANAKWAKPTSMDGPVTTSRRNNDTELRSTVFVRLTARYVDAGAAKLSEILLPADDKAFSIDSTPIPDLVKSLDDTSQVVEDNGTPLFREPKQGEPVPQGQSQVPLTVKDLAQEKIDKAEEKAKKAETRIYDWMVESRYPSHMRNVIHDAARIGVGIMKGPIPVMRRSMALTGGGQEVKKSVMALQVAFKTCPAVKHVDPWNIFPDPACSEDISEGDYIFERDFISEKTLRDLKKQKTYLPEAIDKVIKEGPGKCNVEESRNPYDKRNKNRYEIWYFYGTLNRKDLELCNCEGLDEDQTTAYAIVTMVNDTVIRAVLNPLDSGKFPYHSFPWQRRAGHWAGVGIAEQLFVPQKMCNAATRAMLNNAGKSAGSQIVADQGSIIPADGSWVITPDKVWYKSPDSTVDDVRKAFVAIQFPNMQQPLMNIIEYSMRLAEESTNIPLVTQGFSGTTTPETYGATQLQNNNANQLLRSIGYTVDDLLTEPLVTMFYEWLLLDPSVPDDEKGDFEINAHGSIALVEKAIQDQTIMQMGQMVLNPAFGVDPKRWFAQMVRSKRLDPKEFQYTDEEMQQMQQQQAPVDPRIQVAQMNSQTEMQKAQLSAQVKQQEIQSRVQVDSEVVETERQIAMDNALNRRQELETKRELAMLEYANREKTSLDNVKAKLADTAMRLKVQKELAGVSQALKPAVEPAGRAQPGKAFTQ